MHGSLLVVVIAAIACSPGAPTPDSVTPLSLPLQPQQVFVKKPGQGTITLEPLSGNDGDNQTDTCVIEKQPESVNTTTGSDVKFTVITSLECRHVKVFVNSETAVDSTKVQEENITIPEQYIGWRLLITYTITTVNQSISGIEVLFRAYPDGTVVNSNAALLLVQGIPGQTSNLTVWWSSSHQLNILCTSPPSLDNVQQWAILYSELAPLMYTNTCNLTISLNRASYPNSALFDQYIVSLAWSNHAGEGPNISKSVFLPGEIDIDSLNISKRSCGVQDMCLQVTGNMATQCPGCKPAKIRLYMQLKSGKLRPIGRPHNLHVTEQFSFTIGKNLPLFKIRKHTRRDIIVELSNVVGTVRMPIQSVRSYDVETVKITRQNGRGCISCTFLHNSSALRCFAQITEPSGKVFNITAIRHHLQARTANVCTERVLAQNSIVQVYDVDQNGYLVNSPAYSGSFPNSEPNEPGTKDSITIIIIGCIVGLIIIGGVIAAPIIIALAIRKKRTHDRVTMNTTTTTDDEVAMS